MNACVPSTIARSSGARRLRRAPRGVARPRGGVCRPGHRRPWVSRGRASDAPSDRTPSATTSPLCAARAALSWPWQSYEKQTIPDHPSLAETRSTTTTVPVPRSAKSHPSNDEWRTMNSIASGTVLITGPTGGLGRAATLAIANRLSPNAPTWCWSAEPGQALIRGGQEPGRQERPARDRLRLAHWPSVQRGTEGQASAGTGAVARCAHWWPMPASWSSTLTMPPRTDTS